MGGMVLRNLGNNISDFLFIRIKDARQINTKRNRFSIRQTAIDLGILKKRRAVYLIVIRTEIIIIKRSRQ
jgi:hypothetical protein